MNRKLLKIALIILTSFILIIGGAITYFAITFDQDSMKEKIIYLVHEKTGKQLKINGNLSWSIFPRLGIKINNISLSNAPGFTFDHFAKAQYLAVSIKPIPLILEQKIEADRFALNNFCLHLTTNADGSNNWQTPSVSTTKPSASITTKKTKDIGFSIHKVAITNGTIYWDDKQNNQNIKISALNFTGKDINLEHPFLFQSSFQLNNFDPRIDGKIKIKALTTINPKQELYIFKNLKLRTSNVIGSGSAKIIKTSNQPIVTGNLTLSETDEKSLPRLLGIKSDKTPTSAFKIIAEATPKKIKVPTIQIKLDDTMLKGNANYAANSINFDLNINKLNPFAFNEYHSTSSTKQSTNNIATTTKTTKGSSINTATHTSSKNETAIKLNGKIKINSIQLNETSLDNFIAQISGTTKAINISNFNFDIYQKKAQGDAAIDITSTIPKLRAKLNLKELPIKNLLQDFANYEKFSGNLSVDTNINTYGKTADALVKNLNGNGNILITNGSYSGVDIPYEVRRAHAILNSKPMPKKPNHPQTEFDQLTMSFNIIDSILRTNDLLVQAPNYKVVGAGNANLNQKQIDLEIKAYSKNDKNFLLPIKITGSLTNPKIEPDTSVLLKKGLEKVVNSIGKQIEKHVPDDIKKILPIDKLFK